MSSLATAPTMDLRRWSRGADATELALLDAVTGPVLDIGCGPGRLVAALRDRGIAALGIDAAPAAIALARSRGLTVMTRSVFDTLPREGEWATVLLLDGNIGIGGNPTRLLRRVRTLLTPGGRALVEVEPAGSTTRSGLVKLEIAAEMVGWFPWSWVGADDLAAIACRAGLAARACESSAGRCFGWLQRCAQ